MPISNLKKSTFMKIDNMSPNSILGWTVRVVLVLLATFIVPYLSESTLSILEYSAFRFIVLLCILALTFWDPASAIILSVAFIIGIQTLIRYKISNLGNSIILETSTNQEENYHNFNTHQVPPSVKSSPNIVGSYTTEKQFQDIQTNIIDNSNLNTEVRTWKNELGPQGLTPPNGYNKDSHYHELEEGS